MSQENVEAFKRALEANNRSDYDALLQEFDPDVEWHGVMGVMFGGEATVFRGHAGVLEYLRDLDEGFTVRDIQGSEFRDLGERIAVLGHARGTGRESGSSSTRNKPSKPPDCGIRALTARRRPRVAHARASFP